MGPSQGIGDAHVSVPHDGDDRHHHGFAGTAMSDDPEDAYERAAIHHLTRRLHLSARGVGLEEKATRQIVGEVFADMPTRRLRGYNMTFQSS